MKTIKMLLVAAIAGASAVVVPSIGNFSAADAKAHEKKGKPGSCGTNYYYSKKKKLCVNAAFK